MSDKIDANLVKLQQKFEDGDKVSPFAREAVLSLAEQGIMQGNGRIFNPQQNLTREQAAVLIYNLQNKMK